MGKAEAVSVWAIKLLEKQNPGRLIGSPRRTTGTVPGCSMRKIQVPSDRGQGAIVDIHGESLHCAKIAQLPDGTQRGQRESDSFISVE